MKKLTLICLFLLVTQWITAQKQEKLFEEFDQKIEALIKAYDAVGLAVAVVKDDQIIYAKGFGYRDLENKLPATEETVFHIASMSKAFTGTLLGILESEDQLSLQDKPALYVPGLQFYNDKMNNLITIADLLSHRSGIGGQGASIVMFPEKDKLKTVQRLRYLKPEAAIKNSFEYSNLGYTLAGTIVEQVTGKTWDAYLQEKIFRPLSMQHSFTTVTAMKKTGNYAQGYAKSQGKTVAVPYENYYSYTPAGAIKSSVKDLSHWMLAWLQQGKFRGQQVIPAAYHRQATMLQNTKDELYEADAYLWGEGFGWRLRAWNGHFRVRHGGNTMGFSTIMDLFPFEKIGIVVLSNQKSSLLPYAVSDYISRKLQDLPAFEFPIKVGELYQSEVEDLPLKAGQLPTHDLGDFAGIYQAKGFGSVKVVQENDKLFAVLPTFKFQLAHLRHNFFYLKGTKDFAGEFDPEFTVEFALTPKGEIAALKLYSQKEPVSFYKQ